MIISGNFKSFHTRESSKEYLNILSKYCLKNDIKDKVYIFLPSTCFLDFNSNIKIGAQNFYPAFEGSYTGEICLNHLKEFGILNVLIGHSERRQILNENQSFIKDKFDFAKENNLHITYCIGEPREIKQKGFEEVKKFLLSQFDGIDINYEKLVIAYEPIWAIGTGLSAGIQDIASTLDMLKVYTNKPLLYGGSVNDKNAKDILSINSCDGVLIGSFSLKVDNFCKIIEISKNIKDK